MKKYLRLIFVAVFTAGIFSFTGCEDTSDDRYSPPPWLGGSSIEILEERGEYKHFLALMEKANYTIPISRQLFTLFVPDDAAFEKYFQSIGKTSVEDLSKEEAAQLFTLHVLRNPRSRFQLIYEYVWSELQGPKGEYAALFHRKETPSTSLPYKETVRYTPGFVGQERIIYTTEKNVPLWTEEFFHDYGGAADGSDYKFMYPNSEWKKGYPANLKGMNWHNAMVIPDPELPEEMEVRTASGFIYFLDRVVEPMPSIEEYMIANQDKFGLYYDILQRFATYGGQKVDEQRRVQYLKQYDLVFNLAAENGTETNADIPPRMMWTAFLPSNQVLQNYLDNTVLKYYSSLDSVPRVTLYYILQTQLSATLVVPSKMESYFNAFGDKADISTADIVSQYMASNGAVYETNRVLEPNVFTCVPGLLFFDKNYSTLLFALNQANMLSTLSNPESDVTLFATTNDKLLEYGIRYNATSNVIEQRGAVDGVWRSMNTTDLTLFAQDQIFKGKLEDLNTTGDQYVEMMSGNYIHYNNNMAESVENQVFNRPATVTGVDVNERNGLLVKVDYPIASRFIVGKLLAGEFADPELSEFAKLLVDARLLDERFKDGTTREHLPNLKFFASNKYWTAFIPTNAAIQAARDAGTLPAPGTEMDKFLKYHFIQGNVIFDDGKKSGSFDTHYSYKDPLRPTVTLNAKLKVINQPGNMAIEDLSGQVVYVDHAQANFLVRRGVVHKINSVLNYNSK